MAPGVGIESLSAPGSALFASKSPYLLNGSTPSAYPPYLSLSGTSQATPVVAGTVALMLQANPALTPNAVKAVLQYTAEKYDGYHSFSQGAGFLNARGAVELARFLAGPHAGSVPVNGRMEPAADLGQSARAGRPAHGDGQCVGNGRCLGGRDDTGRADGHVGRLVLDRWLRAGRVEQLGDDLFGARLRRRLHQHRVGPGMRRRRLPEQELVA